MSISERNRRVVDEFRAHGGRVGGAFEGTPLLLLHTLGARTGKERINPLAYRRLRDDTVAVFASSGGSPRHPDWYRNLLAHPEVEVELGDERYRAVARVATGEERTRIWEAQKAARPGLADYERRAAGSREIPVVILERS